MDSRLITGIAISAIVAFHLGLGVGLALSRGGAPPPPPQILCQGGPAMLSSPALTAGASIHPAVSDRAFWEERVVAGALFGDGEVALGTGLGHTLEATVGDTVALYTPGAQGEMISAEVKVSALVQLEDAMADRHCTLVSEALIQRLNLPHPTQQE